MGKIEWVSVNVDSRQVKRIKTIIKRRSYKSVADYVQDAIERRLEPHEIEDEIQQSKLERLEEMEE